ncbi:unnamed protein product [Gongylonema pulchrum]|uniref:Dodecin domain-containing protein n=1 Tax=Gongylonema pulchrum TaxID=637853 RepID=A0A183EK60_9BILA|nr:unnamed protein product [Gongylonema pulchrum]
MQETMTPVITVVVITMQETTMQGIAMRETMASGIADSDFDRAEFHADAVSELRTTDAGQLNNKFVTVLIKRAYVPVTL